MTGQTRKGAVVQSYGGGLKWAWRERKGQGSRVCNVYSHPAVLVGHGADDPDAVLASTRLTAIRGPDPAQNVPRCATRLPVSRASTTLVFGAKTKPPCVGDQRRTHTHTLNQTHTQQA